MRLAPIPIPSLGKYMRIYLAYYFTALLVSLPLNFKSPSCIPGTRPLSYTRTTSISRVCGLPFSLWSQGNPLGKRAPDAQA